MQNEALPRQALQNLNGGSTWGRIARRTASVVVLSVGLAACNATTSITDLFGTQRGAPVETANQPAVDPTGAPDQGLIPDANPWPSDAALPEGEGVELPTLYNDEAAVFEKRVALLLPLSGQHADLGRAMRHAAELAMFDIAGDDFVLMPIDTAGTYQGGQNAARQAVDAGAKMILGPLFSESVSGASEVAKAANVPVIAFSNNRRVAENGVWVSGLIPEDQIARAVGYATTQGHFRFAALLPQNDYGRQIASALNGVVSRVGGSLGRVAFYQPGSESLQQTIRDFANYDARRANLRAHKAQLEADGSAGAKRALRRLEGVDTFGELDFDALILPATGGDLRQVSALLAYFDIDPSVVQFIGTFGWNDPGLFAEPALKGGIFAAPNPENWNLFANRFERTFGSQPPRISSLAYDSAALAALMARDENGITRDALTNPSGFVGVDGIFRLTADGQSERGYAIMQIQPDGAKVIAPAPATFDQVF
ncbi:MULTISPECIES: penicillin-binding protein activator [unclassified Thalassospira]|nr:penicillin-binding protein activator [Thalassospira sp.]MCC4239849.1 penicillin-binding protein activator [Thalassospira povalilytica]RCK28023.1 branched-chain amino acid ABC transporter substrate-binding protein [Thalassospira profundimaris]